MGRLTREMVKRIRESYALNPSYSEVAKELKLNARTIKKHVQNTEHKDKQVQLSSNNTSIGPDAIEVGQRSSLPVKPGHDTCEKGLEGSLNERSPEFETDFISFQRQYLCSIKDSASQEVNELISRGAKSGYLSSDQLLRLTKLREKECFEQGLNSLINPEGRLPKGWERWSCIVCDRALPLIFESEAKLSQISDHKDNRHIVHPRCAELLNL